MRLIDSTPVPCGASRETAKRSDLAGEAGYGYRASHSRYFWGVRLYLVATVEAMPVRWCLAHPKLDEREVMTALLAPRFPSVIARTAGAAFTRPPGRRRPAQEVACKR